MGDKRPTGMRVEFYRDVHGKWRWTQYARNGKIRAASEESFENKGDCVSNWVDGKDEARLIKRSGDLFERTDSGDRVMLSGPELDPMVWRP